MLLFNIIIFSVDTKCWTAPPRSHCEESCWDLPRGPVVKTPPPFSEEVWVRPLARELRSHTPCSPKTKTSNRSDIATNSVKTLKIIHSNIYMYFFLKGWLLHLTCEAVVAQTCGPKRGRSAFSPAEWGSEWKSQLS